jgi:ribosomal protein S11
VSRYVPVLADKCGFTVVTGSISSGPVLIRSVAIPVAAARRGTTPAEGCQKHKPLHDSRKAAGAGSVSGSHVPGSCGHQSVEAAVDKWAAKNDAPTRAEAIRRLVELGLTIKMKAKQPGPACAARAKELATKAIEKIIDPTAPPEERAQRRHRLTKGPSEFREDRVDLPKAKGK